MEAITLINFSGQFYALLGAAIAALAGIGSAIEGSVPVLHPGG